MAGESNEFLSKTGLQYFFGRLKTIFVQQESGKGLSTNDYTTAEKTKLGGIEEGAEANVEYKIIADDHSTSPTGYFTLKLVADGSAITGSSPLTLSNTTNTSNAARTQGMTQYGISVALNEKQDKLDAMTQEEADAGTVTTARSITPAVLHQSISNAVGQITGISFEVVQTLPATGSAGVIYLVSNSGSGQNVYDEYIWVSNAFEKIGTTDVDLSSYWSATNLTAITTAEIDTITA